MKASIEKWLIYQEERFPLKQYIPMVFAFSFCAVSYSAYLRGSQLTFMSFMTAIVTSLGFFMLLRIADEFKDFEEDKTFRPYRPVPRGLIKLKELKVIGIGIIIIQGITAFIFEPKLLIFLMGVWLYFGLMTKEFFIAEWLRSRPIIYMVSHMMIMPLLDFYATACDWVFFDWQKVPLTHLIWFLIASFMNGAVIEIGRKIRRPEDEEKGVETYSVLWGMPKAVVAWNFAMLLSLFMALKAGEEIGILFETALVTIPLVLGSVLWSFKFLKSKGSLSGKLFETLSGVWVLLMYLALGGLPLIIRSIAGGN